MIELQPLLAGNPRGTSPEPPRKVRVLTLTPFYPNSKNHAEGCFVSEPLAFTPRWRIENEVLAVRPLHRGRVRALADIPGTWSPYLCLPGNAGLAGAGRLLAGKILPQIKAIHGRGPIDLIHAHAALPCGAAAHKISEELGVPFVISVHGLDVFSERQAGRLHGRWCRRVSERVYRSARAVICISEKVRNQLAHLNSQTRVIYNGVDAELFLPAVGQTTPLTILSIGNLIPTKGHATLLRAFADTTKPPVDARLAIIGDGAERSRLTRLAKQLGISHRVLFLGQKTRAEVAEAMKRCAIFALPSSYEGLGCVYLEAMSCGKPVIACQGQGIAEIIEHGINGLLVPAMSEAQLAQALRILLLNEDFRFRLGDAARNTVLQQHTLQHQAAQMASVYRECLA